LSPEEIASLAEMGEIRASLGGVVAEIKVKEGDKVAEGDALLVLEAMKMLNTVSSVIEGVVRKVVVGEGSQVAQGELLLQIRPKRSADEES
jgi:biotin carboxyl carrier protein